MIFTMREERVQKGRRGRRPRVPIVPILLAVAVVMLTVIAVLSMKNWVAGKGNSSVQRISSEGSVTTSNPSSHGALTTSNTSQKLNSSSNPSSKGITTSYTSRVSSENIDHTDLASETQKWYLKLANQQNPLPSSFSPTVSEISVKYTQYNNMKFDSRAVEALNTMCAAAKKDGSGLWVISSYRTVKRQTELFDAEVKKQKTVHPNYSDEQAEVAAATVVAIPGTSEHNLGLAVDFNADTEAFENTLQSKWLRAHAEQYGFVMRYPKNKSDITGIIYEPWHYRYVGAYHAKQMNQMGLCLEEYLIYLNGLK